MPKGQYFVYILASKSRRLYVGVTNDLERRIYEHKQKLAEGFTKMYKIDRLVHFEETSDVLAATEREKQIKGLLRTKKIALIEFGNRPGKISAKRGTKRLQKQILRFAQNDMSCHAYANG